MIFIMLQGETEGIKREYLKIKGYRPGVKTLAFLQNLFGTELHQNEIYYIWRYGT